jgi:hypothetical protein
VRVHNHCVPHLAQAVPAFEIVPRKEEQRHVRAFDVLLETADIFEAS